MFNEHQTDLLYMQYRNIAIEKEELNLVATLGLKPFTDGNMYCFLWGDDIQQGVAGFGETVMDAVHDFNKNFSTRKLSPVTPSKPPKEV